MKGIRVKRLFVFMLLSISLLLICTGASFAETDATDMVQVDKGRMLFNRRTSESYLDVSLTNISTDVLLTPIKIVVNGISNSNVVIANADGYTTEGNPYFFYEKPNRNLMPGESIPAKQIRFSNPNRQRFSFTYDVMSSGFVKGFVEIKDVTTILNSEFLANNLLSVSNDFTSFEFSQNIENIITLALGDVLVFDISEQTPHGALRKITNIESANGYVVVETIQASLTDAISDCAVEITHTLSPGEVESAELEEGVIFTHNSPFNFYFDGTTGDGGSLSSSIILYDQDENYNTEYDQVIANGNLTIEVDLHLIINIVNSHLVDFRFTNEVVEFSDLDFTVGGALSFAEERQIAEILLPTMRAAMPVPPFFITATPKLGLILGAEGEVYTTVSTGITQEATMTAGLVCTNGDWSPIRNLNSYFDYYEPELNAGGTIKGYISPRLSLLLYSVAGPFADIEGYLELEANLNIDPWWSLYGGVEVDAGVLVDILGLYEDYEINGLIDFKTLLAQADVSVPGTDILVEDFESYSLNSWPSLWVPDANAHDSANNRIVLDPDNPTNQVLKMYGALNGCWGALGYHPMDLPEDFYIEFKVNNSSESLTGCHQGRSQFGLKHGTYWGNPGYSLMLFHEDPTVGKGWQDVLSNYQQNHWHDVRIHYERSGDQVALTYWMDGAYLGQISESVDLARHLTMDHFNLIVQEGSAYFDDIRIYTP